MVALIILQWRDAEVTTTARFQKLAWMDNVYHLAIVAQGQRAMSSITRQLVNACRVTRATQSRAVSHPATPVTPIHVASMPCVKSTTGTPSASVRKDSLETHSRNAVSWFFIYRSYWFLFKNKCLSFIVNNLEIKGAVKATQIAFSSRMYTVPEKYF